MQSNNPVFRRSAEFNGTQTNAYGNQTYPGNGSAYPGYGAGTTYAEPPARGTGMPQDMHRPTSRMTIDSVVQKSAISLGVVLVAATLTWMFVGNLLDRAISDSDLSQAYAVMAVGSLGAFVLSLVNSFKRVVSPALVLLFCALEGVALGALSKFFDLQFGSGVVTGAVIGTFAAFAGTLAAYKFFNIQLSNRFKKFVMAGVFGMISLALMEIVLGLFGAEIGLFGVSALGMVTAVIGLALGVFMLLMDFDFVEYGVHAGLDDRESWRAAFALTVSLVWIYTNLLRILAFFSQD